MIGRLNSGTIHKNQHVLQIDREGNHHPLKVAQVFTHEGLKRTEVETVTAGDIIALTGLGMWALEIPSPLWNIPSPCPRSR